MTTAATSCFLLLYNRLRLLKILFIPCKKTNTVTRNRSGIDREREESAARGGEREKERETHFNPFCFFAQSQKTLFFEKPLKRYKLMSISLLAVVRR